MIHTAKKVRSYRAGIPVIAAIGACMLLNAQGCAQSVYRSLILCAQNVIPSLFCFMVITRYLARNNAFDTLPGFVTSPLCRLFSVSQQGAGVFLCGLAAGFPLGAKTAAELYADGLISRDEAERLCAFCSNCGPSFLIGCVGCAVWGDARVGLHLYLCQTVCAILCGFCLRFTKEQTPPAQTVKARVQKQYGICTAITDSVLPMLHICAFVLFFGCCTELCDTAVRQFHLPDVLLRSAGILELTQGVLRAPKEDLCTFLVYNGFLLGWSGVCVQMQCTSFMKQNGIGCARYYAARLFSCVVCPLLCRASFALFW